KTYQIADQLRGSIKNGKIQFNAGIQADYTSQDNDSRNNYTGTFQFASLYDYCYAYYLAFGAFNGVNCEPTRAIVENALANGAIPTYTRGDIAIPITGTPTQFSKRFGDSRLFASQGEISAFVESTLRLTKKFSTQVGLRYQAQEHLRDYNNISPRINT